MRLRMAALSRRLVNVYAGAGVAVAFARTATACGRSDPPQAASATSAQIAAAAGIENPLRAIDPLMPVTTLFNCTEAR
jgi:hypothetical protein